MKTQSPDSLICKIKKSGTIAIGSASVVSAIVGGYVGLSGGVVLRDVIDPQTTDSLSFSLKTYLGGAIVFAVGGAVLADKYLDRFECE